MIREPMTFNLSFSQLDGGRGREGKISFMDHSAVTATSSCIGVTDISSLDFTRTYSFIKCFKIWMKVTNGIRKHQTKGVG